MTINEYVEQLSFEQCKEFEQKLYAWLGRYTTEVIERGIDALDKMLNDGIGMELLEEYYKRSKAEAKETAHAIGNLINKEMRGYNVHNHPTTHAEAYANILYDRYLAKKETI